MTKHADGPLHRDGYAIYLPAINDSYAAETAKELPADRPFPSGVTLSDLVFWEPNELWYYPYLLHSVGLYPVGSLPNNTVTQRHRANNTLVGDSGGFQIGKGSMKGLRALRARPMPAQAAVDAWQQETGARDWIVGWLDTYADYAMTLDMPLWATSRDGAGSPFHNCTTTQLIEMTVQNLRFIDRRADGTAKWLNVVQGGETKADIGLWWDAVKWFKRGGWALAGSAGAKGGIASMLHTVLLMRDGGAFEPGQDWVHVLGVSTTTMAVLLTAIQQQLRRLNPNLRVTFDSSSPFQIGGRYEGVALTPTFSSDEKSWSIRYERAPQSRLHADPSLTIPFGHAQSPIGRQLQLHHLSVRDGVWDERNFDSISNTLLTNHNVWVYLDAMKQANDIAEARDTARVPARYLECLAFIEDVFQRDDWSAAIVGNQALLDAVAQSGYKAAKQRSITEFQ